MTSTKNGWNTFRGNCSAPSCPPADTQLAVIRHVVIESAKGTSSSTAPRSSVISSGFHNNVSGNRLRMVGRLASDAPSVPAAIPSAGIGPTIGASFALSSSPRPKKSAIAFSALIRLSVAFLSVRKLAVIAKQMNRENTPPNRTRNHFGLATANVPTATSVQTQNNETQARDASRNPAFRVCETLDCLAGKLTAVRE